MFTTLRSRLIGSYVLIIVTCLAITGIVLAALLIPQVSRLTYLRLAEQGLSITLRVISLRGQGLAPARIVDTLQQRGGIDGNFVLIVTGDGRVLASTEDEWMGRELNVSLQPSERTALLRPYTQGTLRTRQGLFYYVALPTSLRVRAQSEAESETWYVVLLSQPRRMLTSLLADISIGVVATGVVALLVSTGVAFLVARSIAKPLKRITTATEEIARGNYEGQLDITSPEEIHRLATSFNAMAREVEASRQAQRDFVANVSHDLKTPLTSIQGFSQAILDGTAASEDSRLRAAQVIHEEADRMTHLVDDLLDLAQIEAGQVVMAREPVALPFLLRDCAEKMALRAQQADVRLEVHSEGELVVSGDRDRLAQVVSNLIDNALKHTPAGGRITLTARPLVVEPAKRGEPPVSKAEIAISDTGEGIPPEDLSRIFERFYRGDKSRGKSGRGAGLGLAIVREIVQAHGGEIRAESVLGLGTRITLTLPSLSTRSTDDA
jgi:two-component system OmpR family sensor kinase